LGLNRAEQDFNTQASRGSRKVDQMSERSERDVTAAMSVLVLESSVSEVGK